VGDSFAGALGKPLGTLLEAADVRSVLKHTDSSYLTDWAWDGKLQEYVWKYNPDLVMVTLGANELEIVDPELREKTVKKIISVIGERPCVWVAIPLWDGPKNGLLDVIRKNASPCVYMDTNTLIDVAKMPRIRDGIHPTTEARADWAKFVFEWLRKQRAPQEGRPWNLQLK
jgi:lysophospholipase L1-like esterase